MQNTIRELEEIRKRFASLDKLADALQVHPGFEKVNRSTISRWFTKPSKRTILAIQILKGKSKVPTCLRIAELDALWTLPSRMLTWPTDDRKPYGQLKSLWNVELIVQQTQGFVQSANLLAEGAVDIAILPHTLSSSSVSHSIQKLCSVGRVTASILSTKDIRSLYPVNKVRFGFPFDTSILQAMYDMLIVIPPDHRVEYQEVINNSSQAAEYLKSGRLNAIVAWEPFISQVKFQAEIMGLKVYQFQTTDILPRIFGHFFLDLVVNLEKANPRAVRAYLASINQIIDYIYEKRMSSTFHDVVAADYHISSFSAAADALTSTTWALESIQPSTVLTLWEREVTWRNQ